MSFPGQKILRKVRRFGRRCWLCGLEVRLDVDRNHPDAATLDHVIEKRNGGSHKPDNRLIAHRHCNMERSRLFPHLSTDKVSAVLVVQEAIASCR